MLRSTWRFWKINYTGKDGIMKTFEILKMLEHAALICMKVLRNLHQNNTKNSSKQEILYVLGALFMSAFSSLVMGAGKIKNHCVLQCIGLLWNSSGPARNPDWRCDNWVKNHPSAPVQNPTLSRAKESFTRILDIFSK